MIVLLMAQLFFGTISRTNEVTTVMFTNLPPHVITQHSTDLTNWFDKIRFERMDGATNWGSFRYDLVDTNGNIFVRARIP